MRLYDSSWWSSGRFIVNVGWVECSILDVKGEKDLSVSFALAILDV